MSWLFSQALVEGCLPRKNLGSEQYALWSWMNTADAFSLSDRTKDTYDIHSRYGMTFVPLTADRGVAELTLYLEVFLANITRQQRLAETTQNVFGTKCEESWQMSLPNMCLRRMSAKEPSTKLRPTLKRWVTKPGPLPLVRQTWVLTIFGRDIGYLHTPTTKANYAARSMQKWPCAAAFKRVFGVPHPEHHEWLMGWPEGWTDFDALETGKFQSWRWRLCGHLRMLLDFSGAFKRTGEI